MADSRALLKTKIDDDDDADAADLVTRVLVVIVS
jgi:hypothetical protein